MLGNYTIIDIREEHMTLFLTENFYVIGFSLDAEGVSDSVGIDPNQIIRRAKKVGASKIITAHNHPRWLGIPTLADVLVSRRLKKFACKHDIELVEEIILSLSRWYYSFSSMFIL